MSIFPLYKTPQPLGRSRKTAAANWWATAYAAYDAKNASSYANSLLDITGNGRHATTGILPTWANGVGWSFASASIQYLITPFATTSISWSGAARFVGGTLASNTTLFGSYNSATQSFFLQPRPTGLYAGNGIDGVNNAVLLSGHACVAGLNVYANGVLQAFTIPGGGTAPTPVVAIGAFKTVGSAAGFFDGSISSVAFWNYTLSAAEVAALSASMP